MSGAKTSAERESNPARETSVERATRHRASNRGFQIIRIGGREGRRRRALGIGRLMLIDSERVHVFAATLVEINAYLADKPEVATLLHDSQRKRFAGRGPAGLTIWARSTEVNW